jgi:hypothetical protein
LSKKDTVYLEYAANAAYLDKDYDMALEYFTTLKDLQSSEISNHDGSTLQLLQFFKS